RALSIDSHVPCSPVSPRTAPPGYSSSTGLQGGGTSNGSPGTGQLPLIQIYSAPEVYAGRMVPSPTAPTPEAVSESLMPAVGAVRRLLRRLAGPVVAAAPFEVSPAQREVLLVVGKRAGRSVAEIADELGLAPNTVSTIVTQLVGAGLLVRETDPQDRRVGRLRLTASAQEALDAARARRRGVLHEA